MSHNVSDETSRSLMTEKGRKLHHIEESTDTRIKVSAAKPDGSGRKFEIFGTESNVKKAIDVISKMEECSETIQVPPHAVARVIGSGGANLRAVAECTGARCDVTGGVVTVRGSAVAVRAAANAMRQTVARAAL